MNNTTLTYPASAFRPSSDIPVADFRRRLNDACDYSLPAPGSKRYRRVEVLLLYWSSSDLNVENELYRLRDCFLQGYAYRCTVDQIPVSEAHLKRWLQRRLEQFCTNSGHEDLLIFYYAGHGRRGIHGSEMPCVFASNDGSDPKNYAEVNFSVAKEGTLDDTSADVLYLLDCCYATTAGIRAGKELIAACSIEAGTPIPGPHSFTAGIVQELNNACGNPAVRRSPYYLTAAQLCFKLYDQVFRGALKNTPVHTERMVGPFPRSSILIVPRRYYGGPDESPDAPTSNKSTFPLTGPNLIPVGSARVDRKVLLCVHLRDGTDQTLRRLRQWLTTDRPGGVDNNGVDYQYWVPSASILVFFSIPIPVYYGLVSHPAIQFIGYVRDLPGQQPGFDLPTPPAPLKENVPPSPGGTSGYGKGPQSGYGRGGPSDGSMQGYR
ncbi:MAG: hypothetical protein Q9181_005322 [Wetmoreana brouardii]